MNDRVVRTLSLSSLDQAWDDTVDHSRLISSFREFMHASGRHAAKFIPGRLWFKSVDTAGFLMALALLGALPWPGFAADKGGLAVLAVVGVSFYVLSVLLSDATMPRRRGGAVDMLVLCWLGSCIASTCASHYFLAGISGLLKVCIYLLSYFWFERTIGSSKNRTISAVAVLIGAGFVTALYGLYQYHIGVEPLATWEDPTVEQKAVRIYSTLRNPNLLAGYLTPMAPLAVAGAVMLNHARRRAAAWLVSGLALVLCIAIVLTGSRGAFLALFSWAGFLTLVGVADWCMRSGGQKRHMLLPALVPLLAVPLLIHAFPPLEQRVASIFAGREHSSNAFRLNVWQACWRMFLDNWWLGIGPGSKTFMLAYGLYMVSGYDALGAYCVPLEIGVETGIPGLIVLCLLMTAVFFRAHLVFNSEGSEFDRWLCAGCSAALVGIMAHGLVDTVFFRPQVQFVFWFLIALIAASYERTYAQRRQFQEA